MAGHIVAVRDADSDPRTSANVETFRQVGVRALIAVPLMRDEQQVSSLIVTVSEPRDWTPREITLVETVAERAWMAVETLRAETEREQLLAREQAARAEAERANR